MNANPSPITPSERDAERQLVRAIRRVRKGDMVEIKAALAKRERKNARRAALATLAASVSPERTPVEPGRFRHLDPAHYRIARVTKMVVPATDL